MKYLVLILTAFTLLLCRCKSPSDRIMDKFKEVNDSIKKLNTGLISKNYETAYQYIQARRTDDPQLALQADSLFTAVSATSLYIEQLKARLIAIDSVGDRSKASEKLLFRTPASDSLKTMLLRVYQYSYAGFTGRKKELDKALHDIDKIRTDKDWTHNYFHHTPTFVALVILAEFDNTCVHSATLTFLDMLHKFEKPKVELLPNK